MSNHEITTADRWRWVTHLHGISLEELRKQTNRLHLVVYEGTNAEAIVHPTEPEIFINHYRSASTREGLHYAAWTKTMTLEDIKNQLRMRKTSMYDPIVVDSWQFFIIDREIGQPFELLDIVQEALLMLVGNLSPRSVANCVIQSLLHRLMKLDMGKHTYALGSERSLI
ncbi:hypothetical protein BU25DRAFT_461119 [Macroventuria anomochaeta]|uniref:Uncharacterized protein n=1 Tax=Macroventuria anomochaeta TaxID=301207 RepID=A0ACB6RS98_9PLEO|nr:uncharacterized protein BU25DRAFT_461119 [Macroventuria anomochaeta]KAF2624598.1 hypothetical protein BU25DRAFT_461119 [Macroventuria anomochaeta]